MKQKLRSELPIKNLYDRMRHSTKDPVEWRIENSPVTYDAALSFMEDRVSNILENKESELIWLVEHPPLYTGGTSTKMNDLILPDLFPVYKSGRGGEWTYHGPGQRVVYVMLDLRHRCQDVRLFISALEEWIIRTLSNIGIEGERREERVGVWVKHFDETNSKNPKMVENKIAAIGIRVRRWVTFHGISINVNPDLSHYKGINPCGIKDYGITSCHELGHTLSMAMLDQILQKTFNSIFEPNLSDCPK